MGEVERAGEEEGDRSWLNSSQKKNGNALIMEYIGACASQNSTLLSSLCAVEITLRSGVKMAAKRSGKTTLVRLLMINSTQTSEQSKFLYLKLVGLMITTM